MYTSIKGMERMALNTTNETNQPETLFGAYFVCLLISTIFFLLFGFNSPIYKFNTDHDYQWFMTMGNGLINGKIPYRDLFEQKGPIVYFVTAFCCLFPAPDTIMLFIEIISMSLFFFFAYRIARKSLSNIYALITVPILAFAVFTCWCRMFSAATIEEFALPIYTYFLHCWLEFLTEKKSWNWVRSLCLGLCFGVILWSKFTLFYFMLIPMVTWLILNIRRKHFKSIFTNSLLILIGITIVSVPILTFYTLHSALDDLFYVYYYLNLTAYGTTNIIGIITNFRLFFAIGPAILFLILWGVLNFTIKNWHEVTGKLLLIAFIFHLALLVWSSRKILYYYGALFPYAILGVIDLLKLLSNRLKITNLRKWIYPSIVAILFILCIPCNVLTYQWGRSKDEYTPLVVADIIKDYEIAHDIEATLFCYKFHDFGFYNAADIVPNNYYFANNAFKEENFPELYSSFNQYIQEQTSDFLITQLKTWEAEKDFIGQYYQPYTKDLTTSTFHYRKIHDFLNRNFYLVLLIKK